MLYKVELCLYKRIPFSVQSSSYKLFHLRKISKKLYYSNRGKTFTYEKIYV